MEIKSLIVESLKIPVIELFEPIIPPCATWSHLSDASGLEGDGTESEGLEEYQIDVWDRSRETIKTRARKLSDDIQTNASTTIPNITYMYDTNGKVWRAMIRFSKIREE